MVPCIEFVARVYPSLKYLISICTGAVIVAQAGVVDGMRGTTNKRAWQWVTGLRPQVEWVEKARWHVDGKWWSGSGVSAGIDVAFAWIAEVFGEEVAAGCAVKMEYMRRMDPGDDPFAEIYGLGGDKGTGEGKGRN
jgi:transcriptional regulator GlxA family with amidase domain